MRDRDGYERDSHVARSFLSRVLVSLDIAFSMRRIRELRVYFLPSFFLLFVFYLFYFIFFFVKTNRVAKPRKYNSCEGTTIIHVKSSDYA